MASLFLPARKRSCPSSLSPIDPSTAHIKKTAKPVHIGTQLRGFLFYSIYIIIAPRSATHPDYLYQLPDAVSQMGSAYWLIRFDPQSLPVS